MQGRLACVVLDAQTGAPQGAFIKERLAEIAAFEDAVRIAIDVPMGVENITTPLGRGCDTALRRELGQRQSSVFAVPARAALAETDYRLACEAALAHRTRGAWYPSNASTSSRRSARPMR